MVSTEVDAVYPSLYKPQPFGPLICYIRRVELTYQLQAREEYVPFITNPAVKMNKANGVVVVYSTDDYRDGTALAHTQSCRILNPSSRVENHTLTPHFPTHRFPTSTCLPQTYIIILEARRIQKYRELSNTPAMLGNLILLSASMFVKPLQVVARPK